MRLAVIVYIQCSKYTRYNSIGVYFEMMHRETLILMNRLIAICHQVYKVVGVSALLEDYKLGGIIENDPKRKCTHCISPQGTRVHTLFIYRY